MIIPLNTNNFFFTSTLLLFLLITPSANSLKKRLNLSSSFPSSTKQIKYSPDSTFLAAITPEEFYITNSPLATNLTEYAILATSLQSLSFNPNGTKVANLGLFMSGEKEYFGISIFNINAISSKLLFTRTITGTVVDSCWSHDGEYVVFATSGGKIGVHRADAWDISFIEYEEAITDVDCSHINNEFAVSFGERDKNTSAKITIFEILYTNGTFEEKLNITDLLSQQYVTSLKYNLLSTKLYCTTSPYSTSATSGAIFYVELASQFITMLPIEGSFVNIQVSDQEKIIVASTLAFVYVYEEKIVPSIIELASGGYGWFELERSGNSLLYYSTNNNDDGAGSLLEVGPCDVGYYYSEPTQECLKCTDTCAYCILPYNHQQSTYCYQCVSNYYLDQDKHICVGCPSECSTCTSSEYCTQCKSNYVINSQHACACPSNKYEDKNSHVCVECPENCTSCQSVDKCTGCVENYVMNEEQKCVEKGAGQLWVILGVVLGILVVVVIVVVGVVIKVRRSRKSPLLDDAEEDEKE